MTAKLVESYNRESSFAGTRKHPLRCCISTVSDDAGALKILLVVTLTAEFTERSEE